MDLKQPWTSKVLIPLHMHLVEIRWHFSILTKLPADDLPGCYNGDPWRELIGVVSNQPVRLREEERSAGRDCLFLK